MAKPTNLAMFTYRSNSTSVADQPTNLAGTTSGTAVGPVMPSAAWIKRRRSTWPVMKDDRLAAALTFSEQLSCGAWQLDDFWFMVDIMGIYRHELCNQYNLGYDYIGIMLLDR